MIDISFIFEFNLFLGFWKISNKNKRQSQGWDVPI